MVREIRNRELEIVALARLGLANASIGDYAKAIECYQRLILKHPLGVPLTILGVALCIMFVTIFLFLIIFGVPLYIIIILAPLLWQKLCGMGHKTTYLDKRSHSS